VAISLCDLIIGPRLGRSVERQCQLAGGQARKDGSAKADSSQLQDPDLSLGTMKATKGLSMSCSPICGAGSFEPDQSLRHGVALPAPCGRRSIEPY
jgi:hypothetical protein